MSSEDTKPHDLRALLHRYEEKYRRHPHRQTAFDEPAGRADWNATDHARGNAAYTATSGRPSPKSPSPARETPPSTSDPGTAQRLLSIVKDLKNSATWKAWYVRAMNGARRMSAVSKLSLLMLAPIAAVVPRVLAQADTGAVREFAASSTEGASSAQLPLNEDRIEPLHALRAPLPKRGESENATAAPADSAEPPEARVASPVEGGETVPLTNGAIPTPTEDPVAGVSAQRTPTPGVGVTLERLAVDALLAGDHEAALERYHELSHRMPAAPVYREAIRILTSTVRRSHVTRSLQPLDSESVSTLRASEKRQTPTMAHSSSSL